ncbi:MAG TPA: hypothetical protein VIO13_09145 [Candidatus Dormibacteraeota bacterium]
MTGRRGALAATVLALLALAAVRGSGGGPPLYDGICLPPKYLMLGAQPGPPTKSQTYTAGDLGQSFELADNDSTPQAQIIVGAGSLAPAAGSSTVTVSITPVKTPATRPAGGSIDGNVYSFDARSGGQAVALAAGHPATIVLGATSSGGSQLVLEHFDGTRWTALKTFQSGCGTTYEAASPTLGVFVLVTQGASTSTSPSSPGGGGSPTILIVVVVVVLVLALIIGGVRVGRRRR